MAAKRTASKTTTKATASKRKASTASKAKATASKRKAPVAKVETPAVNTPETVTEAVAAAPKRGPGRPVNPESKLQRSMARMRELGDVPRDVVIKDFQDNLGFSEHNAILYYYNARNRIKVLDARAEGNTPAAE